MHGDGWSAGVLMGCHVEPVCWLVPGWWVGNGAALTTCGGVTHMALAMWLLMLVGVDGHAVVEPALCGGLGLLSLGCWVLHLCVWLGGGTWFCGGIYAVLNCGSRHGLAG